MYKCKECGAEYDVKPDYCDCGNDEFEEILITHTAENSDKLTEKISDKNLNEEVIQKPKPASSKSKFTPPPVRKTFSEQYPQISRIFTSLDPISLAFFCICLLFSFYIILYAWNPAENGTIGEVKQDIEIAKNIPSIDKFWNNSLPVVKVSEPKKETTEKVFNQINPTIIPQKNVTQKPVQQTKTVKTQATTSKVTKVPLVKKTSQTVPKQQTVTTSQVQNNQVAQVVAKKKAEQERLAAEEAQLKKLQAEQVKKAAEEKIKQEAAAKQEFVVYKAKLRNAIGSKIDFTRVIGDGTCVVAFKLDSNGKLINRSFAKQSSNNTLNDAVYNAVMSTPTFNPPPSAYKNEILNLNIKFYNGNFEISLP